jgi:hypothetical protein
MDNGIDDLPGLKAVLQLKGSSGEDLSQEFCEESLAHAAPEFGRAKEIFKASDRLADIDHLLCCFLQAAEC